MKLIYRRNIIIAGIKIIDTEINTQGNCYIICESMNGECFEEVVEAACDASVSKGARHIYFTCKDNAVVLDRNYFGIGRYMFNYYTDYNILIKDFVTEKISNIFGIQFLTQANASIYIKLHNEAFKNVPLSILINEYEIERILTDPDAEAGLFVKDGTIYGTYEIEYGDIPEISALSINTSLQGHGYGKLALKTIEQHLKSRGYVNAEMFVASINKRAYSLYLNCGYTLKKQVSTWYSVTM
ncbi:MAG: hypothetical protein K0R50_2544 [Eubacterium sp.]|jgi:GNAT superfamily N-acetyltransferase|nr:hypothetical protein [Eubacterium sp.]